HGARERVCSGAPPRAADPPRSPRGWRDGHAPDRLVVCLAFFSTRFSFRLLPAFFDWCWRVDLSAIVVLFSPAECGGVVMAPSASAMVNVAEPIRQSAMPRGTTTDV